MELPGRAPAPIGVYDHPHDADVPGLHSKPVGDNFPADLARKFTGVTNDVLGFLNNLGPDF